MIKVVFKVKVHFSLVRPDVYRCPAGSPKLNRLSGIPQIQTICVREMWLSGLSDMLSPTRGPNTKGNQPTTHPFLFLQDHSLPALFPTTGTLLVGALSFKTDDSHLTFTMRLL